MLYELSIDRSEPTPVAARRVGNIVERLTWEVFAWVQRGLFEQHRMVFAFMLSIAVQARPPALQLGIPGVPQRSSAGSAVKRSRSNLNCPGSQGGGWRRP